MTFPSFVQTREVSIGTASLLISADPLVIEVTITPSRGLVWDATGDRFEASTLTTKGNLGAVSYALYAYIPDAVRDLGKRLRQRKRAGLRKRTLAISHTRHIKQEYYSSSQQSPHGFGRKNGSKRIR